MPTLHDLFQRYNTLTTKQRGVLDYLRDNPETICYITLRDLSERAKVSEVSILRLCRTLGFTGFSELKDQFREELVESRRGSPRFEISGQDAFPTLAENRATALAGILSDEARNISDLLSSISGESLFQCASAMLASNKIYIFGHDGCKILADYLAHRLNYFRINAVSIQMGNMDSVRVQLSKLREGDFVVLFSFPDYYKPARGIARFAEHRGIPVMTVTDSVDAPAVVESGYTFVCGTGTTSFINSFTAPSSIINILTLCIASEMGETRLNEIIEAERRVNRFMSWDSPDGYEDPLWPGPETMKRN